MVKTDSLLCLGFLQKKQYQEKFPINVDHKANKDGATTLPSSFDSLSVIKGMNYCNVDKIALSTPIDQIRRMLDKDLDIYQICQVAIGAPNTTKTKDVILQKAVMEEPEKHQKKAEDAMSDGSRKDILSKNFNTQNVSPKKRMAILLTYSEDANDMIPELLKRFWDAGIGVVSEHGLRGKGFFETSFRASWESFFKQVCIDILIILFF